MGIDARNRSLPDWFTRIRTRQLVLPRFQRFEAWGNSNITQIFNTILQELPVGALLVLEIGKEEPFIWRPVKTAPETGERVNEYLLDGQQRVTAIWRGLHNNYEERTYFLYMLPDTETGMPYFVDSISRWRNQADIEFRPFWANAPVEQWKRKMIPLHLCAPGDDAASKFREWAKIAMPDYDEREVITDKISAIRTKFASFNLPFLSLPVGTKPETALDVFIKMNTSAEPLSIFDIVVAQVEASLGTSLHDLVAEIKRTCPAITDYYPPENLALYANALLQGKSPSDTIYMSKEFGPTLLENWNAFLNGVKRAVEFLEEERVFDSARLPTDVVIPVLVALWSIAPDGLDAEGRVRTLMRRYLWRAFFSNRYEKSTASRSLVDFNELKNCMNNPAAKQPVIFDDDQSPLPTAQELISAGWPTRKERRSRAILALALKEGGHDLADGSTASRANLGKREYHHIFPDAHLQRNGFSEDKIYVSLNCALVTWRTNRNISDKEPEHYLAERCEGSSIGENEIRARLATHLIPFDEMLAGNYEAFLKKRAVMVYEVMTKLCGDQQQSELNTQCQQDVNS
ncbi:MAG: GmrSD restriction endonuclease domain-containing protein [Sulfuricella sp.]